jgi:hypothetical protein
MEIVLSREEFALIKKGINPFKEILKETYENNKFGKLLLKLRGQTLAIYLLNEVIKQNNLTYENYNVVLFWVITCHNFSKIGPELFDIFETVESLRKNQNIFDFNLNALNYFLQKPLIKPLTNYGDFISDCFDLLLKPEKRVELINKEKIDNESIQNTEVKENKEDEKLLKKKIKEEKPQLLIKRGRGRPPKLDENGNPIPKKEKLPPIVDENGNEIKRGRGRPKKVVE